MNLDSSTNSLFFKIINEKFLKTKLFLFICLQII